MKTVVPRAEGSVVHLAAMMVASRVVCLVDNLAGSTAETKAGNWVGPRAAKTAEKTAVPRVED